MKHITFYCYAACLLLTTDIASQNLPENPTIQQVIGYHQFEQQRWNTMQLPKNSVLFKSERKYAGWQSFQFDFKKEKRPEVNLFMARYSPLQSNKVTDFSSNSKSPFQQSNLKLPKHSYNQWQKENWLKDLLDGQGSLWLREFIIQNKNKNFFHL